MGKRTNFIAECEEGRLDVTVLERLEAESPVITSSAVDKDEGEFESPN
jgi:hypothetical protein